MKRIKSIIVSIFIFTLFTTNICNAAESKFLPDIKVHKYPNGLTLLVLEKHDTPIVVCYRYHKVGSIHEETGKTGIAHFLEHLAFKGTTRFNTIDYNKEVPIMKEIDDLMAEADKEKLKGETGGKADKEKIAQLLAKVKKLQEAERQYICKDETDAIYDSVGASGNNASTWFDRTDYYLKIPSNRLEVWTYIESEKLKDPIFREFFSERDVVLEERRMYDTDIDAALYETLYQTMFTTLPYGHDTLGWPSDVGQLKRKDIQEFFKRYYAPNNTTIVLVGDIKFDKAVELVGKYFSGIPPQELPDMRITPEPIQEGERRAEVETNTKPQMLIGFHGPKPSDEDIYAFEVINYLLSYGMTSRFQKNLVQTNIAYECSGDFSDLACESLLEIRATPKEPNTCEDLEKAIYKELDRIKKGDITKWEMEKVRNQIDMEATGIIRYPFYLAENLAKNQAWTGDWRNFDKSEKLKKVTIKDIKRVANKYLTRKNRTVVTAVPE